MQESKKNMQINPDELDLFVNTINSEKLKNKNALKCL